MATKNLTKTIAEEMIRDTALKYISYFRKHIKPDIDREIKKYEIRASQAIPYSNKIASFFKMNCTTFEKVYDFSYKILYDTQKFYDCLFYVSDTQDIDVNIVASTLPLDTEMYIIKQYENYVVIDTREIKKILYQNIELKNAQNFLFQ
jgi:hypothetical protein